MNSRELTIDEFNALNYFVSNKRPVSVIEINTIPILKSNTFIDTIRTIELTSNALAYFGCNNGLFEQPNDVELIHKNDDGTYSATSFGEEYVNYYKSQVLI